MSGEDTLASYIETLRKKVTDCDQFKWRNEIPNDAHPHITIMNPQDTPGVNISTSDILWDPDVRRIVDTYNQRRRRPGRTFRVAYPTLYTKYKDGWADLQDDPENE